MKKILVATTNQGKMAELIEMLGDTGGDVRWLSLSDLPEVDEVVEDGETFAQNACKKALGYAKATGYWTIADDSGLVIDALNGAPGVISARFSGPPDPPGKGQDRTLIDHRNTAKVLSLMKDVPAEKRTARFVCSLALASPQDILIQTEGVFEGRIAREETGENGFGYDPIFFVPSQNKTAAELTGGEKNAISHRGSALSKLKPLLAALVQSQTS